MSKMTPAQIFLEMLKPDGRPQRQLKQYEAFGFVSGNPIGAYVRGIRKRGEVSYDKWGTCYLFPVDAAGPMPHITAENKVLKDITAWKSAVKAPDLEANCRTGWEPLRLQAEEIRSSGRLVSFVMGTGIFEQTHFLMGFEDTLTNLYEHPKEMHELIEYITEYRLKYAQILIDELHPDMILSHDDWGTKDALFMKADMWREFFKEPYRRFYDYIRSRGVIPIHHADSYLVPIIEDMVEIGIPAWQGVLPENDIPALQQQLQGRMILMGGIGAAIDRVDSTEEEIRSYVKHVLNTCCPRGAFIPCITYGGPGTIYPHVDPLIDDEIDRYNEILHLPNYRPAAPVRRVRSSAASAAVQKEVFSAGSESLQAAISEALRKGQKNKVLTLCKEALAAGLDAQTILTEGLVDGMAKLGDDFSEGEVFVPEMLLAAKCMAAATEVLKPYLVKTAQTSAGRVCLGTVRGDMHDIGKNLVKIMMEGSGLEVIDLGVDVAPEIFVETAEEQHCDIIACSALLTTTLPEMRKVVELADEKGLRSRVKILIGGAPVTQSFCDEIGADYYTEDAAAAARCAAAIL